MKTSGILSVVLSTVFLMAFTLRPESAGNPINPECKSYKLDFELINQTGYDIESIYISPSNEASWGEDIMGKDLLKDGESVEIVFDATETEKHWDMYVTWDGYEADEDVFWTDLNLSKISEITLFYEEKTGKTWAVTK
jgi:hypothetical protein